MSAATPFEQAKAYGTATIYEALKIDTMVDPAIRTVWRGAKLAAPAYTVQCAPGDNLAIHVAMERAPRGSVLVVDAGGFVAGYWGEVLTVAAEAAGVVGLVIDGGVRDTEAIAAHAFPTFARGISIRGTVKASMPGTGKPVRIGGCPVATGDIVIADDDGIVVVPAARFDEALQKSQARVAKELEMMDKLRAGVSSLEQIKMTQWRDK
ncbi:dimethylmenaquinone methyltransferase [Ramlibacter sp. G-1-2-2]|uniref:Putative 4-hydroxy-4-methyl-2-oxoglutarate aldolase n=1 Tax=Ramlibacter agri TaxID=2728837 RepID=A0A848GZL4_9BURK|nr:dimethylmenaquinone methyltransferase [Ramlibacter agri]NML42250.1 dimethylmenaquinone methyltransferase [Ramlibacter agri]